MFTPRRINRLLDYYKNISISRPILARANMGLDFVSGQYRCLFYRCRKYVINSLIHGHFHIGLIIILRPILASDSVSGQYGGLWMITRPIWKCPLLICIYTKGQVGRNLWYILYEFGRHFHLCEKNRFTLNFSHLITIYVCLISYRKRLIVEGIVI
jgi:hypothetical protein